MSRRQNRTRTFGWRAEMRSPHIHNNQVNWRKTVRRFRKATVLAGRSFRSLAPTMKGLADVL